MAHKSFSYKGYEIWLASKQPSKTARGSKIRTLQVRKPLGEGWLIKKQFRYDTTDVYAYSKACNKATDWIDQQISE